MDILFKRMYLCMDLNINFGHQSIKKLKCYLNLSLKKLIFLDINHVYLN